MNIIVPTAGAEPGQRIVSYVVNIAERLKAKLVVLRILSQKEAEAEGEEILNLFIEDGKAQNVPVNGIISRGEITSVIIEVAEDKSADLIILGTSHGEIIAEWMNAKAMEKTDIPVLLIPKWVSARKKSSPNN